MITYTNHTSKNRPKSEKNHLLNKASNEGELSDLIRFYRLFWFWNMKSLSSYPTEWLSHHLYTIHRWKKERREKMITVVILHKRLQRSKAKQLGSTGLTCPRYRWSLWPPCLQQSDRTRKICFTADRNSVFGVHRSAFGVRRSANYPCRKMNEHMLSFLEILMVKVISYSRLQVGETYRRL